MSQPDSRLIDSLPLPTFIIGTDHELLHWNKALQELVGFDAEKTTGTGLHTGLFSAAGRRTAADIVLDAALNKTTAAGSGAALSGPSPEKYETTDFFPAMRGGAWLHITAKALRDSAGNVLGAMQCFEDVTEITHAKQALLESEKQLGKRIGLLQQLLDYMRDPDGICPEFSNCLIEKCVEISESRIGFLGRVSDDGAVMTMNLWPERAPDTLVENNAFKIDIETGGIWTESVRTHNVFVDNAPVRTKPDDVLGQIPLRRYLSIPVNNGGKTIAVLGLINKEQDYTPDDIVYLSLFIEYIFTIRQKKKAELALADLNKKFSSLVEEFEEKTIETQSLNDMVNRLHNCSSTEDVFSLSAVYFQKLCPGSSGTLYLINSSTNFAEAVKSWGTSGGSADLFVPMDCRALCCGRPYLVDSRHPGLPCGHHSDNGSCAFLCIPITAHGKTMGILHISQSLPELEHTLSKKLQICNTAAEHISLTLINLQLIETLRQQAVRDMLTGLFNRRYLEESLPLILNRAERTGIPVGIVMFDIDHFKDFNDTYGHDGGDVLLRELGVFLNDNIRSGDIVVRYGGDEFVAVLPGATLQNTVQRAEDLRRKVKDIRAFHLGKPLGGCTLSFGVAVYPEHGLITDRLLKTADDALYQAKHGGRDRVAVATG